MPLDDLELDHRRLRICFLLAAGMLLAVLVLILVREQQRSWRVLQRQFISLYAIGAGAAEEPGIRQYYTCASKTDRCPSCHLGMGRDGFRDEKIALPFRAHGPGLRAHLPDRIGCSACHGGQGRSLDSRTAHQSASHHKQDPLMRGPHIQASCARCHVPGAKPGQERLGQGARLYLGLGCSLCHPLTKGGRGGWDFGPDLTGIGRKDLGYLKTSLIEPAENFPGSTMPSFRLALEKEPEAMEDLLIYLESLVLERLPDCAGKKKHQSLVYGPCVGCHDGESGSAAGRMKHRCLYLLEGADELRCVNCHSAGVPPTGPGKGYCPLLQQHRSACVVCHDVD